MTDFLSLLFNEGICEYGIVDFDKLKVINKKLLPNEQINSAMMIIVPYRHKSHVINDDLNAGLFARCLDYHKYFKSLFERLIPNLERLTDGSVYGFADHSPIHEKDAARKCGLGFIGKNSLLITKRYGSFVFIGTLLFTAKLKERILISEGGCGNCIACVSACPVCALSESVDTAKCLSAVSQKKNKNDADRKILKMHKTVWGCDICQNACPYNNNAEYGTVDYFAESFIERFSTEYIDTMNENEYKSRAFSFRERKVIAENILTALDNRGIISTK